MLQSLRGAYRRKFRPSWPKAEAAKKPSWRDEFSDGCTIVSDHPQTLHCCLAHDRAYYEARDSWRGRMRADREFRECMQTAGWTWRAWVRWSGVRAFGWIAWYT